MDALVYNMSLLWSENIGGGGGGLGYKHVAPTERGFLVHVIITGTVFAPTERDF